MKLDKPLTREICALSQGKRGEENRCSEEGDAHVDEDWVSKRMKLLEVGVEVVEA